MSVDHDLKLGRDKIDIVIKDFYFF